MTGAQFQIGLHWLNGTFPADRLQAVRDLVSGFLGAPEDRDYGRHTYQKSARWAAGAELLWSDGRAEAMLSMTGGALGFIPQSHQRPFLVALVNVHGLKGTRIDVAGDDLGRRLSMDELHRVATARDFYPFRTVATHREIRDGQVSGDSVTFGQRGKLGSGLQVQVYDKGLESGGEIDAIRIEARAFKERAALLVEDLADCTSDDAFIGKLRRFLGGSIDFRERGDETHVERRPRLSWWAALLEILGRARYVVTKPIPPLQRFCDYVQRCVAPGLALVRQVMDSVGWDFAGQLLRAVDEAEVRISDTRKRQDWQHLGLTSGFA